MDDETRQFLTEKVLGLCWHEVTAHYSSRVCMKCGLKYASHDNTPIQNRPFSTHDDMMDLYQAVEKAGKWEEFYRFATEEPYRKTKSFLDGSSFISWFFCLSGSGHEDRCQMVAEFWREQE